ncbi:MAG: sugar phosphate isomerase/epimerase family protein [Candidatus Latescibacterota bacterium]|nr:sugar phosphate isomerase/epimerase family protein [Candidatus Latescibacterota bacterium]
MELGVITDGISSDFEHALKVLTEQGLDRAELQYVWENEVGDHSDEEIGRIKTLADAHGVKISCISRHNFAGLPVMDTEIRDEVYASHMDGLKRCIKMAKAVGSTLVRTMSFRKEMIIFGGNGAQDWIVSEGAWDKFLKMMEAPVQLAEDEGITLVVETGNNSMITSGYLGRKFVDAMGSDRLRILWDISNTMYCTDIPYPNAYEEIKDIIGHVHIKDAVSNISRATVAFQPLGEGDVAQYVDDIANALKRDGYTGGVSYESVYRPAGGTFEDGFRASVGKFREIFG